METRFFQHLFDLQPTGEWIIAIKPSSNGRIVVSALYKDAACTDPASHRIPPLHFNEVPAKIDAAFFSDLKSAVTDTVQLFNNMEHYRKQLEAANKNSQMQKEKTVKADKEKTESEKKYDAGLKKAKELEAEGKYRDAWMKVPEPGDYPDQADFLRKRREELSAHFAPDLFNA
ncbi:prtrc system protein e [Pedobacter nutrimenti]|uniref:prtrc system protein e n=1 Tax=Pedobacter nutrimenti TaxID=1241337 RepID=UPI0029312CD9|nr:prtrc system protein e [Pedobacter nutrimenti]